LAHLNELKQIAENIKDGISELEDFFGGEMPVESENKGQQNKDD